MSRRARPILVEGEASEPLARVGLGKDEGYDELWIQTLIHRHPDCLPFDEIEEGLGRFHPVCMELPTAHGPVDNLLVTAEGVPAIVEAKLWRNPEARRKAVAQALDYASCLFEMDYSGLEAAVLAATAAGGGKPRRIMDCFPEGEAPDEAEFVDAVNANLRRGRMLVLVAGDGIRTEMRRLGEMLQSHAGLRFTFGLVEMAVFRLPDGRHLVQPRTLAKTEMVERGVVRIEDGRATVAPADGRRDPAPAAKSISAETFFEDMARLDPSLPGRLGGFLKALEAHGVRPEFRKSLILRFDPPEGKPANLGYIMRRGEVWTDLVDNSVPPEIGHPYLEALAELFGGRVEKEAMGGNWHVRVGDKPPRLDAVADRLDAWAEEIGRAAARLRSFEGDA